MADGEVTNGDISNPASGSGYSRSRRKVASQTRKRVVILTMLLAIAILALVVETIYISVGVSALREQKKVLMLRLEEAQQQSEELSGKLDQAQAELAEMIEGRFPNLHSFELNKVISLDHPQLQNIVFTRIKRGEQLLYTYRVLVMNDSVTLFKPSFRILLFDRMGVHIGSAQWTDEAILAIGETDTYAGEIEHILSLEPQHFMVEPTQLSE